MSNDYFEHTTHRVSDGSIARGADVNNPLDQVEQGFESLPPLQSLLQGKISYAVDTGAANVYVVAMDRAYTSYADGMTVVFKASATNTGASTINVDGLGAVAIRRSDGAAVAANDIQVSRISTLRYNSTSGTFEIQNALPSMTSEAATARDAAIVAQGLAEDAQAAAELAKTGAETAETNAGNSATAAATSASTAATHALTFTGYNSVTTTAVNKTLAAGELCAVTVSGRTISLPATPSAGDRCGVSVGNFADTVISGNGNNIRVAGSTDTTATVNRAYAVVAVVFDGTDWRVF